MTDTDIATLTLLRDRISYFNADCQAAEHTDTGIAWLILHDIEEAIADIVKRHATADDTNRSVTPA